MSSGFRKNVLWQFTLSAWGMVTLVLLFCVVLLVNEMTKAGESPWGAFLREDAPPPAQEPAQRRPETTLGSREIALYFASSEGGLLETERDTIEYGASTAANCRTALERLIAGPRDVLTPILPPSVRVRGIYLLEDGELVVDFSGEIVSEHLRFSSAAMECLMIYGVVNTLTQDALRGPEDLPVRRVRFLFEGALPEEVYPSHAALDAPVEPRRDWIGGGAAVPDHG